jgi:Leucine-rich repeat (LRR) protein
VLRGLPQLRTLNLFNNRISQITLPADPSLLSNLQILDVGSNQLEWLPDKLDQLASLLLLKVMNNRIQVVSRRICEIPTLREIDGLISNDMVMPPKSECAWGLCRMKRYYNQLAMEEERKKQAKDCPRRPSYKTL